MRFCLHHNLFFFAAILLIFANINREKVADGKE
jgi:hypothetical protein